MRRSLLSLGRVGTLIFLSLFVYFYKNSGKFRQSIISAFVALTVFSSGLTRARAVGEADAFTPQPQHLSRPSDRSRSGFFSGRSSNAGSGPDKPDDFDSDSGGDGLPKLPQVELVEKTEERIENIETLIRRMEEDSDTESESEEDQCDQQNKSGINELPDSSKFIYNLGTKTARKAVKRAWKNSEARKEIISNLEKIDRGDLLPRNEKDFKGFKTLKELKFTKTRMLVRPGKNGKPDEVIAICLRRDLDVVAKKLKNKFD